MFLAALNAHAKTHSFDRVTERTLSHPRYQVLLTRLQRYARESEYPELVPHVCALVQDTEASLDTAGDGGFEYQRQRLSQLAGVWDVPELARLELLGKREERVVRDFASGNVVKVRACAKAYPAKDVNECVADLILNRAMRSTYSKYSAFYSKRVREVIKSRFEELVFGPGDMEWIDVAIVGLYN